MEIKENSPEFRGDSPLKNPSDDKLGHAPFAKDLAESIIKMIPSDGFVMAIYGDWGSGKTTVLHFIETYLNAMEKHEKPLIVHFNPWWFSGTDQLLARFFDAMKSELKGSKAPEDYVELLGDFATALENIPVDAIKATGGLTNFFLKLCGRKSHDVRTAYEKLVKRLRQEEKRIVVIIDDVDRLYPKEVREIFRLVRSVADLPFTLFLFAMDRNVVIEALSQSDLKDGDKYLEKIIQLGRELPIPFEYQFKDIFFQGLKSILGQDWDELQKDERWENPSSGWSSWENMSNFLDTPRRVFRLLNDLQATYPLVRGHVNLTDFVLWRFLRVFAHAESQAVINEPNMFVSDPLAEISDQAGEKKITRAERLNALLEINNRNQKMTSSQISCVEHVLIHLFPRLWGIIGEEKDSASIIFNEPPRDLSRWVREKRICAGFDFFSFYSRGEAVPWLSSANDIDELVCQKSDEISRKLLEFIDISEPVYGSKTRRIMFYLPHFVHAMNNMQAGQLVRAMLDVGDILILKLGKFTTYGGGMNDSLWNMQGLILQLVNKFEAQTDRFNLLKSCVSNGRALSLNIAVIRSLQGINSERESNNREEFIVGQQQIDELVKIAQEKIHEAVQADKIIECAMLKWVLTIWHFWKPQQATEWVQSAAKNPQHLARLLESFAFWATEKTIGIPSAWFGLKNILPIIDPKSIIQEVRALDGQIDLTKEQSKAREAFIIEYESIEEGSG